MDNKQYFIKSIENELARNTGLTTTTEMDLILKNPSGLANVTVTDLNKDNYLYIVGGFSIYNSMVHPGARSNDTSGEEDDLVVETF